MLDECKQPSQSEVLSLLEGIHVRGFFYGSLLDSGSKK